MWLEVIRQRGGVLVGVALVTWDSRSGSGSNDQEGVAAEGGTSAVNNK